MIPYAFPAALFQARANALGPGYPSGSLGSSFANLPTPLQMALLGGSPHFLAQLPPQSQGLLMGSLVPYVARAPKTEQIAALGPGAALASKGGS